MIDWDHLNALRADIGEEDFADVAALFIAEITEHLDGLKAARHDVSAADFHFLRGSAANLGFIALQDACVTAEAVCKGGQVPDVAAVATVFAESLAQVSSELPGLDMAA